MLVKCIFLGIRESMSGDKWNSQIKNAKILLEEPHTTPSRTLWRPWRTKQTQQNIKNASMLLCSEVSMLKIAQGGLVSEWTWRKCTVILIKKWRKPSRENLTFKRNSVLGEGLYCKRNLSSKAWLVSKRRSKFFQIDVVKLCFYNCPFLLKIHSFFLCFLRWLFIFTLDFHTCMWLFW